MTSLLEPSAARALERTWPPALRLLLTEEASGLWSAVLGPLGGSLEGLRATGVAYQPGGSATVQYSAALSWTDGRRSRELLAATTGARIPSGAAVVEGESAGDRMQVGLWRWPLDPALPALAWATRAAPTGARLADLGLGVGPVRLRLRAYRPGRRAVVEATGEHGRLFLKIVRPSAVAGLAHRHAVLRAAVPTAPVLATTDDGVVVLPGLPGTPMRDLIRGDGPGLPSPATLDALLDRLPDEAAEVPARGRRPPGDALARAGDHAAVLAAVAGHLEPRLMALTGRLAEAERGEHDLVPVHGDFYESQLLVVDGAVVGLLDVDTVGRGHRIDDWTTLLGHLALLEQILPEPGTAAAYRQSIEEHVLGRWPAEQVRPRVAAVLVGLATGPFRVQQAGWPERTEARVALAERWAGAAGG